MLKRLHLKNFTVFADADFEFGPGLNVLVGTNGTGKSHVLKVGYVIVDDLVRRWQDMKKGLPNEKIDYQRLDLQFLEDKLRAVFQPVPFEHRMLIRRGLNYDTSVESAFERVTSIEAQINYDEQSISEAWSLSLNDMSKSPLSVEQIVGSKSDSGKPIFIPAKEVLTMGWLLPQYEQFKLSVDQTYTDLLSLLSVLPLRNPESTAVLKNIEEIIGGKVERAGEHYFLSKAGAQQMEMNLIAEGLRKFATLYQLLANGSLTKNTTLYWDEPESNLNPALLRQLAAILAELARQGFQIILATHSMSLLKEFHILSREPDKEKLPIRYFGLNAEPGQPTTVVTRDDFKYLPDVVALEVELDQADDLEEIFARESR